MDKPTLSISRRLRATPFSARVMREGVRSYTIYNHMLLPTVFRSLEQDYHHLKRHVQLWDVSCERQVEISGPDAPRLVQLMTPRDLRGARVGQCLYAPLVDETGALINDPIVLKRSEERFWLSIADSDVLLWAKGLAFGLGLHAKVEEPDVSPLAVQGPKAEALMARVFGEAVRGIGFFRFAVLNFRDHPLLVARSGWSGQGGFEIYLDRPELGEGLWDTLWEAGADLQVAPGCPNLIERIESGLLSYGNDMTYQDNPLQCGLERFCHHQRDIDCISREALRRIAGEGADRRVMGLKIDAASLPQCTVPWPIHARGSTIGRVTSAAFSPDFGCGVALAMLARGHWSPGDTVTVQLPGSRRAATVCTLPFVSSQTPGQPASECQ
jgi:dimethylsulfoniopropionate demethylase